MKKVALKLLLIRNKDYPGLFTSWGCCRLCCEESSECGNLMLVARMMRSRHSLRSLVMTWSSTAIGPQQSRCS